MSVGADPFADPIPESVVVVAPRSGPGARLAAGAMSAFLPGAGQWFLGRRRRAVAFFVPALVIGFLAVAFVALRPATVVAWVVQPRFLWALLALNLVVLVLRGVAAVDAVFGNGSIHPWWTVPAVVVIVTAIVAPHAVVASYGLEAIDLLETVFVDDDPPAAAPAPPMIRGVPDEFGPPPSIVILQPEASPAELPDYSPGLTFLPDGLDEEGIAATRRTFAPRQVTPFEAPFLPLTERVELDRVTVLLAGGDAGPGRGGLRTDTIIVASLDTVSGAATLIGVPRNFARIPLPSRFGNAFFDLQVRMEERAWTQAAEEEAAAAEAAAGNTGGNPGKGRRRTTTTTTTAPPEPAPCHCFPEQINALYTNTRTWTRTFPGAVDPGMEALRQTMENFLGLRIDYYVLVDMAGFVDVIDAIGGVDLEIIEPVHTRVSPPREGEEWILVNLQPGRSHVSGTEALAYVRSRYGTSDYSRMTRQRCLLDAVAAEADPLTIVSRFPAIAAAVKDSTATNIPLTFLPDLVTIASGLGAEDITTYGFRPGHYAPTRDAFGHPIPDTGRVRWKVQELLATSGTSLATDGIDECAPEPGG